VRLDRKRLVVAIAIASFATTTQLQARPGSNEPLSEYLQALPVTAPKPFESSQQVTLAASPLSCADRPQASAPSLDYLWSHQGKPQLLEQYRERRVFHGCFDWHSSVNSYWTLLSLLKRNPELPVAAAIRNSFEEHFERGKFNGELEYFSTLRGEDANFEMPYGYSWLLKLYGEVKSWRDPQGVRLASAMEPFKSYMTRRYTHYLQTLDYPVRAGLHTNTALTMGLALDYATQARDRSMQTVIRESALRLFGGDSGCPTALEPVFGDFASPCLAEAALMGRVMKPNAYAQWLDAFLPPVDAEEFQVYARAIDIFSGANPDTPGPKGIPNAHLIGLSFQRAAALATMAAHLPASDPRVEAYGHLAMLNSIEGYNKIGLAGYWGNHWLATFAVLYETAAAELRANRSPP
jgi:hypothetical protein